MRFKLLPSKMNLRGKRVLVRVDWNIPQVHPLPEEDTLKIQESIAFIRSLTHRGAVVILMTHLGRPKKRDRFHSTKRLSVIVEKRFGLKVVFHPEFVSRLDQRTQLQKKLAQALAGSIHLLENVRFEAGEETNRRSLAKAYAELGDIFINDAFASSHRAHASVLGIAQCLPSYAGTNLVQEISKLSRLIHKPSRPFVSIIGGVKIETKIPLLRTLLREGDTVLLGNGQAAGLKKMPALARRFLASGKIQLPEGDPVDAKDTSAHALSAWGKVIAKAKTIVWNGPIGVIEDPRYAKGSYTLAKMLALRARKGAFVVVGGGDTIPIILHTKTKAAFGHISMGGGAMLEFIAKQGKLSGLKPLER